MPITWFCIKLLYTINMKLPQNIGTCVVLINDIGSILLGKRKNAYKAGMYGLPGGRIEYGEAMAVALAREVFEETGIIVENFDYVGVVRETQEEYEFVHFVFSAQVGSMMAELKEPEKCEGWEWIDINEGSSDFNLEQVLKGHAAGIKLYTDKKGLADLTSYA